MSDRPLLQTKRSRAPETEEEKEEKRRRSSLSQCSPKRCEVGDNHEHSSEAAAGKQKANEKRQKALDQIKATYKSIEDIEITTEEEQVVNGHRCGDFTRLKSIAGVPIADISNRTLIKFFSLAQIGGYKNKTRLEMCNLLVASKLCNGARGCRGKTQRKAKHTSYSTTADLIVAVGAEDSGQRQVVIDDKQTITEEELKLRKKKLPPKTWFVSMAY